MISLILTALGREAMTTEVLLAVVSCTLAEAANDPKAKTFTYLSGQLDTLRALGLLSVVDCIEADESEESDPVRKSG